MKDIFKKNQIIITALAIMIVIAGYLHFVENKKDALDASTTDTIDYDAHKETAGDDITDGDLVSVEGSDLLLGELGDEDADVAESKDGVAGDETEDDGTDEYADISDEDGAVDVDGDTVYDVSDSGEVIIDDEGKETSAPGEAIFVSTTIGANFFVTAKLEREQLRAANRERFTEIIDNVNLTAELKEGAVAGLLNLTNIAEKENTAETSLEAKGFQDVIVNILEDNVEVIVNAESITERDVAKIEDIVKRVAGVTSAEIHISPVVIGE